MAKSMYEELGVDASKQSVRDIFSQIIDNEYKGAFVNIVTDPFNESRAMTQHQDGDGSKFIQRMLHYLETRDANVFCGMVDDAFSMNTGDIAASGFVFGPWLLTDVLNVNLNKELKEVVMKAVALRFSELKKLYSDYGFNIKFLGGETADLPDQVKSGVFDMAITAWSDKSDLIKGNVEPGNTIYGFSSDGQALWENFPNSGIMSNGLTMARSFLMSEFYNRKYPYLRRDGHFYRGKYLVGNESDLIKEMTVSEAILSPTRQWAILIKIIIETLKEADALHMLRGISMNTGGGATKISHVGGDNIAYVKNMPTPPGIFELIKQESGETWDNMYKSFNCGIGIDVVGEDNDKFKELLQVASKKTDIGLHQLGYVIEKTPKTPKVTLRTRRGNFLY